MVAVLYDFDGLLIDTETAGLVSWRETYAEFGCELDVEHWLTETLAGRGPCMPRAQLEALVGEPIDWDAVERRWAARRNEMLGLRPGAREHLAACERIGAAKGIVSTAPECWIKERLKCCGVDIGRFDVVVTESWGLARKPAPDTYLAALRELCVPATEAVAFEDSPRGVQAAQAAGLACVAVPNLVTEHFDLSRADLLLPALHAVPLEEVLDALLPGSRVGGGRQNPPPRAPPPAG